MARKQPAWQRLVSEGWFQSRDEAARWILSGKVRAGNTPLTSAGQLIAPEDALHVKGADARYVAKGGYKLEGALQAFAIDVRGRVCIDAGASTGGFTDCLVRHGAQRIYAVDVGFGQLAGSLRANPRVVNLERTNIGDGALLALNPCPTLGTVDLSYLSLRKAVPQFAAILHHQGALVCLVKPLFEIDDAQARRTGTLSPGAYAPMLNALCGDFAEAGYAIMGVTHSPVTGNQGTVEFFLYIALDHSPGLTPSQWQQANLDAVQAALALPLYHKG